MIGARVPGGYAATRAFLAPAWGPLEPQAGAAAARVRLQYNSWVMRARKTVPPPWWRRWAGLSLLAAGLCLRPAWAAPPPMALPTFAGWRPVAHAVLTTPDWGLSAPDAAVMREFALRALVQDTDQRDGRRIQIQALRFADADGAFGAFTYYRPAGAARLDLGQPGELSAAAGPAVLFTRGDWLVRVQMDRVTPQLPAEMRALAAALTPIAGDSLRSALPNHLPTAGLLSGSVRYVQGPAGFAAACDWVSPQAVGFDLGANAILARYTAAPAAGAIDLVLIDYPTPQLAISHLAGLQKDAGYQIRRDATLLILAHGADANRVQALLSAVHADAEFTIVPLPPLGVGAVANLLVGIFFLCGFIMAVAVVLGVLTGALNVVAHRLWPRFFARVGHGTLTRLQLK